MRNDPGPVMFFCVLILAATLMLALAQYLRFRRRELLHSERMAALERGVPVPSEELGVGSTSSLPRTLLLRGLMWLFSGIAITVFLFATSLSVRREVPASVRVFDANQAKERGASEEQVRQIMNEKDRGGMPPGLALIGLIPIGVGLAYIITYRTENRTGAMVVNP